MMSQEEKNQRISHGVKKAIRRRGTNKQSKIVEMKDLILDMIAEGKNTEKIARYLQISPSSVRNVAKGRI
jgi:DNA-binding NarL/FixJ family response regulator